MIGKRKIVNNFQPTKDLNVVDTETNVIAVKKNKPTFDWIDFTQGIVEFIFLLEMWVLLGNLFFYM